MCPPEAVANLSDAAGGGGRLDGDEEREDLVVARKIGSRYTITSVLGRGTCGTVWEGEGPDGPVAVKLLREDLAADQTLIARFVQERTALTSLHHPNVVGVRDLVVDGTDLALVMDLVGGSDLRHRLEAERCLRPALAVGIVADVAEGLAAAHAQGIIHRDVKPENILLDNSSGALRARLADFGIARLVDGPRRTRATRIIGTPDYLAPEVIEGCQPGPPVDLYSLGTVLFELLAGWTPFGGGHPGAVLRRHVTEKVPVLPGIPGPLAALIASCLAKGPAARLTAAELAVRLRELLPLLGDMPTLDIPDPREGGWDVRSSARASMHGSPRPGGRAPTIDPIPMRHSGIVPLVHNSDFRDDSGDTHLNLMRPIKDRETGDVRRRSGTQDGSARSAEKRSGSGSSGGAGGASGAGSGEAAAKRPRWIAATAAALLVGGAAAAAALSMSGSPGEPEKGSDGDSHAPAGATATASAKPNITTRAGEVSTGGLAFAGGKELPNLPSAIQGAPRAAAMRDAAGRTTLYVFVTGADGTIWYLAGTDAHVWTPLHGLKAGAEPAVVSTGTGRLELFVTAYGDGQVQRRSFVDGVWSPKWAPVGQVHLAGAPGVVALADGTVVLAGAAADKTLMTATGTPASAASTGSPAGSDGLTWADWTAVPGIGDVAPAVALAANPAMSGFVVYAERATDQSVLALGFSYQAWATPVQTPLTGAPAAATSGNGTPYGFARAASGGVRVYGGTSGPATSGGVDSVLPPAATTTPEGKIALVTAVSPIKLRVSYGG
jgi:serine/threonine-protein kinase